MPRGTAAKKLDARCIIRRPGSPRPPAFLEVSGTTPAFNGSVTVSLTGTGTP
jgi:hypothetical protein